MNRVCYSSVAYTHCVPVDYMHLCEQCENKLSSLFMDLSIHPTVIVLFNYTIQLHLYEQSNKNLPWINIYKFLLLFLLLSMVTKNILI